jgi:UDP-N-acetylmuramoylalanine--D-glutamate ligase
MKEAVSIAREVTPQGKTCLLSPASPSYGLFKNFEERGEQFRREIID